MRILPRDLTFISGDYKEAREGCVQAEQFHPDDYNQFLTSLHMLELIHAEEINMYPTRAKLATWISQVSVWAVQWASCQSGRDASLTFTPWCCKLVAPDCGPIYI